MNDFSFPMLKQTGLETTKYEVEILQTANYHSCHTVISDIQDGPKTPDCF